MCAAAFALTFVAALHTGRGLSLDRSAFERVSGNASLPFRVASERTLQTIDAASVAAAVLVLAFLALVRGRLARAAAAAAVVALSVGSAELLKQALPEAAGRPPTFPSGHTAVAVSLGLALVLAVPAVLRPAAALAGAAYGAAIAYSVVVRGWHFPSDAIGSFFVCGFWAALVAAVLPGTARRPSLSLAGIVVAAGAVAAALLVAAAVASRHPVAVDAVRSRPAMVAAAGAYGLLALALFAAFTPLVGERR